METAGVDPDISFDLSVALSEACANAVEHGGSGARGSGARRRGVPGHRLSGRRPCRIEVTDFGSGLPGRDGGAARRPVGLAENGRGSA